MRAVWIGALMCCAATTAAAQKTDPGYVLSIGATEISTIVGSSGEVSLTIAPAAGFSIDEDGPLRIRVTVEPTDGIDVDRRRYRRKHAADSRARAPRFDLRYRALAVGAYAMTIDIRFWICRRYTCRAAHETRRVAIEVRSPPPSHDSAPEKP